MMHVVVQDLANNQKFCWITHRGRVRAAGIFVLVRVSMLGPPPAAIALVANAVLDAS
jgi:hypothetical protein